MNLNVFLNGFAGRIEAAGGDVIEALHGHKCGPDCWHQQGPSFVPEKLVVHPICFDCFLIHPSLEKLQITVRFERCEVRCSICGAQSDDPVFIATRDVP